MKKVLSREQQVAQMHLMAVKGVISELPEEQRAKVQSAIERVRSLVMEDFTVGTRALGFIGLEIQIDEKGSYLESVKTGPIADALEKLPLIG